MQFRVNNRMIVWEIILFNSSLTHALIVVRCLYRNSTNKFKQIPGRICWESQSYLFVHSERRLVKLYKIIILTKVYLIPNILCFRLVTRPLSNIIWGFAFLAFKRFIIFIMGWDLYTCFFKQSTSAYGSYTACLACLTNTG